MGTSPATHLWAITFSNDVTLPLEVFTQRNFVAHFFNRSWILLAKTAKLCFVPPFGELRGNVHGSSMARWKAGGRLPISAISHGSSAMSRYWSKLWTFFASSIGWGTISRYRSKSFSSKGEWVTLSTNFTGEWGVAHQWPFASKKLESLGYHTALFAWSYV